jgi:hypothetical protein
VEIFDMANDRVKVTMTENGEPFILYISGSTSYQRLGNRPWTKTNLNAAAAMLPHTAASAASPRTDYSAKIVQLPDRRVNGTLMGAFRRTVSAAPFESGANPKANRTLVVTCLYEKMTGRARACFAGKAIVIKFDHYNDPSNAFVIPAAALRARPRFPAADVR